VLKADRPVEVSYRLTAKRFDWKEWPTKAIDQNEKPGFIID
jgi:Flp pilus assembly protein CpaB